jgi:hypothetical protein
VALRTAERTGVLVIRVWIEPGAGGGIRARITRTLDVAERDEVATAASTPEEITRTVGDWLDAFLAAAGGDAAVTAP